MTEHRGAAFLRSPEVRVVGPSAGLGGIVRPLPREPVDDETRHYGAICGTQHYEATCVLHANAMSYAPGWWYAEFFDTTGDGDLLLATFARILQDAMGQVGQALVSASLRPITRAEFEALATEGQA